MGLSTKYIPTLHKRLKLLQWQINITPHKQILSHLKLPIANILQQHNFPSAFELDMYDSFIVLLLYGEVAVGWKLLLQSSHGF